MGISASSRRFFLNFTELNAKEKVHE